MTVDLVDLGDQLTIKMTREQAAAILIVASLVDTSVVYPGIVELANQANRIIQGSGAPAGVISQVLGEHRSKRG